MRFGGLRQLLTADPDALCQTPGLGRPSMRNSRRSPKWGSGIWAQRWREGRRSNPPPIPNSTCNRGFTIYRNEVFCCLFLDNRHRVLAFDELFRGTLNGTAVYPREIVKRALAHNAAAVILVHNHPSGVAEPSRADETLTARLQEALTLVDVRLLDHLVVGGRGDGVFQRARDAVATVSPGIPGWPGARGPDTGRLARGQFRSRQIL